MAFASEVNGHRIILDATEEVGGKDQGPRPKPLLLASLAGCTGMDVASLLKKMRAEVAGFSMLITAEVNEEHPKYYRKIHLTYRFYDDNPDKAKIEKAVKLSQDRYCGVSYMLRQAAELVWRIEYYPSSEAPE